MLQFIPATFFLSAPLLIRVCRYKMVQVFFIKLVLILYLTSRRMLRHVHTIIKRRLNALEKPIYLLYITVGWTLCVWYRHFKWNCLGESECCDCIRNNVVQWQTLVKSVMYLPIMYVAADFLFYWAAFSVSKWRRNFKRGRKLIIMTILVSSKVFIDRFCEMWGDDRDDEYPIFQNAVLCNTFRRRPTFRRNQLPLC